MKKAELGDYFLYYGKLVKCEWINDGNKSIGFKYPQEHTCPHCKQKHEIEVAYNIIESSPNFQEGAEPIKSIAESNIIKR